MDRHDLPARVFKVKVHKLVTKGKIFGDMKYMYTIEWQKRGLPHVHLLLWLMEKLRPNQIDEIISAEIPNPETDQKLYDTVTKNMTHGPCGALNPSSPCMKERKCTKKYPMELLKDTKIKEKCCPPYRRRSPEDGGHVPRYYTWNVLLKEWKCRVQGAPINGWPGVKAGDAPGLIYTVHVSNFECYCLRMLLNVIQGPN
ncbi:ATP-dependent DNA helicase [Trichonephila clavipes]|nr:ATP-dependent DNA helicase [Trichonephila clavipes]